MSTRLVDPSIFTEDGEGLLGSVCKDCGTVAFPAQRSCSRCSGSAAIPSVLPTRGTLWAYTIQHFEPKRPFRHDGEFVPFGLAYVDLGPVVIESRLTVSELESLSPGLPVHLVIEPLFTDEDGTVVQGFAFAPDTTEEDLS